jgi:hypothetical protein
MDFGNFIRTMITDGTPAPVAYPEALTYRVEEEDKRRAEEQAKERAALDSQLLAVKTLDGVPTGAILRWLELHEFISYSADRTRIIKPGTAKLVRAEQQRTAKLHEEFERDLDKLAGDRELRRRQQLSEQIAETEQEIPAKQAERASLLQAPKKPAWGPVDDGAGRPPSPKERADRLRELGNYKSPADLALSRSEVEWDWSRRGLFGGRQFAENLVNYFLHDPRWERKTMLGRWEYYEGFPIDGVNAEANAKAGWLPLARVPDFGSRGEVLKKVLGWSVEAGDVISEVAEAKAKFVELRLEFVRLRRKTNDLREDAMVDARLDGELAKHLEQVRDLEDQIAEQRDVLAELGIDSGRVR